MTNGNGLGCLIMTAVVDQGFRQRLLTEPAAIMSDFDLTEDEQEALTSIRAGSLTEFAAKLHQWFIQRDPLTLAFGKENGSSDSQTEETALASERMNGPVTTSRNGYYANGKHDPLPLSVEVSRRPEGETALNEKEVAVPLASQKIE